MTNTHPSDPTGAQAVLDFWLGDGLRRGWCSDQRDDLWFGGGAELDARIRERFGDLVAQAVDGGLRGWEARIDTRLALVLLLDQFTRNAFRGQARAFAGDPRAQALVRQALAEGQDEHLATVGRVFLYMPLVHAEDLALQDQSVGHFARLCETCAPELRETLQRHLHFARLHRDIVLRFGRFPHRNAALGRHSTAEEIAFLKDGPRFGQ
ncbi:DUF924 family protein [Hydrogenophaga sp.]|uniref:DUF924 family protein n=1 Tax=Hydrogenophaga sp. TaxID=1904254 RepID=UPI0026338358|nr:DUF924 family protein [Hydrogenophaga sp.]MCW5653499.1 DUF924 domain-containing protein [Hydrogenophaga sp.]